MSAELQRRMRQAPILEWLEAGGRLVALVWEDGKTRGQESAYFVAALMNRRRRITRLVPGHKVSWRHEGGYGEMTAFFVSLDGRTAYQDQELRGRKFETIWAQDYAPNPVGQKRRRPFLDLFITMHFPERAGFGADVLGPIHELQFLPGMEPDERKPREVPALPAATHLQRRPEPESAAAGRDLPDSLPGLPERLELNPLRAWEDSLNTYLQMPAWWGKRRARGSLDGPLLKQPPSPPHS